MTDFADTYPFITLCGGLLAWLTFVTLVSLAYRLWARKPLFAHRPEGALFDETWSSGRSSKWWCKRVPMAVNCLRVSVTPSVLEVRPHFPFNLMFMPECNGLEHRIPRSHVRSIAREGNSFADWVIVTFGQPGEPTRTLRLLPRNAQALVDALRLPEPAV